MNEQSKRLESLNLFALSLSRPNDATENRAVTVVMTKPRAQTHCSSVYLSFDRQARLQAPRPV